MLDTAREVRPDTGCRRFYQVHGLSVASSVPLPAWAAADPVARCDVEIRSESIAPLLEGAAYRGPLVQAGPRAFQLEMPGIARYLVRDGRTVLVDPVPSARPDDVSLFLLNRALPALLLQRGYLPLDASAVVVGEAVTLLSGRTGCGKSALAAALQARGCRVLGDDVTCLSPRLDRVVLRPGAPRLYLWRDVLETLGMEVPQDRRVRRGSPHPPERYEVPLDESMAPSPVHRIVVLDRFTQQGIEVAEVEANERAELVLSHALLYHFAEYMGVQAATIMMAGAAARQCEMVRIWRPSAVPTPKALEDLAEAVLHACG